MYMNFLNEDFVIFHKTSLIGKVSKQFMDYVNFLMRYLGDLWDISSIYWSYILLSKLIVLIKGCKVLGNGKNVRL